MRIDDIIYFSKNFKTAYLDLDNGEELLYAFIDRVEEFYLKPAEELDDEWHAFAKGVLVLTAIDFIGKYFIGGANSYRIKEFCRGLQSFEGLDSKTVEIAISTINDSYRNGLIHEGRIKNLGQFSYDFSELIERSDSYSMINPRIFLEEVRYRFHLLAKSIEASTHDLERFRQRIFSDFKPEIDALP